MATKMVQWIQNKREAEKFLAEKVSEVTQGKYTEPSKELYGAYLQSWLEDKKMQVRPSTWKTCDWIARCYVLAHLGKMELSKKGNGSLDRG